MRGHGLVAEGAPFGERGLRLNWGGVSGYGYAKCACGEMSPHILRSANLRKAWHREHKAAVGS